MKHTRNILMTLFITVLAAVAVIVALFESDLLPFGCYAGSSEQGEFLIVTMMELLTLALIPLALRLFKFKSVEADLQQRREQALLKWGLLRLLMLLVPMLVNTLLYYMYANTTFGYMAIIVTLTLPFVCPSMNRCLSEVES